MCGEVKAVLSSSSCAAIETHPRDLVLGLNFVHAEIVPVISMRSLVDSADLIIVGSVDRMQQTGAGSIELSGRDYDRLDFRAEISVYETGPLGGQDRESSELRERHDRTSFFKRGSSSDSRFERRIRVISNHSPWRDDRGLVPLPPRTRESSVLG